MTPTNIKFPAYLLATNKTEAPGKTMILQTAKPNLIGHVWTFKEELEFVSFLNRYKGLGVIAIPGYKIAIALWRTLDGKIQVTADLEQDIERILKEMAAFYTVERIEDKPGYYKKFVYYGEVV